MSQWILLDFLCDAHGKFEALVKRAQRANEPCPTCRASSNAIDTYAVMGRMKQGEVTRGKKEDGDRPSWVLNTENLADGQDPGEWRAEETKRLKEVRRK